MAVVSHLLKLADGHKRQSEASRWLSFTCHLNRPVLNQIITKAPDSAHQDTNPSLCPRMEVIEKKAEPWRPYPRGWRDMAISQLLLTWAEFLISYGERVGGLESWAGRGGDINEMYPNQLCVAPQPSRHLIMWCPCQAADDYGLILSIFTSSFGNLNYSSLLIVIRERRRNSRDQRLWWKLILQKKPKNGTEF